MKPWIKNEFMFRNIKEQKIQKQIFDVKRNSSDSYCQYIVQFALNVL